jgi:hypothetical protein
MHRSSLAALLTEFYFQTFENDPNPNDSDSQLEAETNPNPNDVNQLDAETLQLIEKLLKSFFVKGINLDNVKYLLQNYKPQDGLENTKENIAMDFLNSCFSSKRHTGYFHFEGTERNGFLKIDDLKRPFPPQSDYSLVFWLNLETIDTIRGLSILQFFDEKSGSVVFDLNCTPDFKLRLEASTRSSVLNYQFQPCTWYHIAIIHQKPLLGSHNSKFFVNGNLIETLTIGYLGQAGAIKKVKTIIGSSDSSSANDSIWGLGSMLFIEDTVLEDSDILYMFRNSQEFSGNWQRVTNVEDSISDGILDNEQKSAVTAISYVFSPFISKDYVNIKEEKIILSICAESDINFLLEGYEQERKISEYLLKIESHAGKVLNLSNCKMTASLPNLIDCRGEIIAINFENIFNGIWRLGGVNILITLIDLSVASESLMKALSLLHQALKHSPKIRTEMIRNKMFDILLVILLRKNQLFTSSIIHELRNCISWNRYNFLIDSVVLMTLHIQMLFDVYFFI